MKTVISILSVFFLLAPFWVSANAAEQLHIPLHGDWDFTYTGTSNLDIPEIPPSAAFDGKIQVPGRWDSQLDRFKNTKWWPQAIFKPTLGPVQYLSGIGWHRRSIDAPKNWEGKIVTLTIGSAVGTTHVWLNRKHLGTNELGVYTPFELDLTNKLELGQANELIIAIDNAKPNLFGSWALMGNAGMATGLSRPVTIDVSAGFGRIADVYVKPGVDLKEVVWQSELVNPRKQELAASKLQWVVREYSSKRELGRGETKVPAFGKSHEITWKAHLDEIKPWSDREPNLYVTELRWLDDKGELLDAREQRFGLRRWSYEGRKLFLNGQPEYLRLEFGAYYFPIDGAVTMSKEYWLRHMQRVKELGLNGINFAAQVCPIEMMEAADETGVILQCGDDVTTQPEGKPYYRKVWEPIVRTTRRYPSLAIYGFGGELKYYEGVIEHNKVQKDLIQSLHPESLVMPQQAIHGIDYGIESNEPGVKNTPFQHHAERLTRYTQACDLFGHYSIGAFSHQYFNVPWREMEKRFKIYEKPLVAHELFISASYLSPDNAKKYTGRIPPYIYTRLEGDLKKEELVDKWPTYFDHTSRLQHICRKYCVEKARHCDELAGYELLGMTDMHFITPEYAVGVYDEFLEMKPGGTTEGVRKYCGESILLLDFDRGVGLNRCYWEGEPFVVDAMVSLFGPTKMSAGKLTWSLSDGDKKLLGETVDVTGIENGHVSTLTQLSFDWPKVEKTARLKLSLELSGSGYDLKNDWDFWVFPKSSPPAVVAAADAKSMGLLKNRYPDLKTNDAPEKPKLWVVSRVGAKEIEHLERGGDVILLGTDPFTAYTQWPYFYPAKGMRPFSNGGTIIAKHPIFAGHPNEGWNDWLFYPLLQGANSVLFDGSIDMVFDPIMELISSAGQVRKQALVFEQRVGKGRLLVATAVFRMDNASCVTLMDSILKYAQSPDFQPKHSLEAVQLSRAALPPALTMNRLDDPGFEKAGYWVTEDGQVEYDTSIVHEGSKALKLSVLKDEVQKNKHASSGVSARQMGFKVSPQQVKLSGWFKTDLSDASAKLQVRAVIRLADAHIRSEIFVLEVPSTSGDWKYFEKAFDVNGKINYASVYVLLSDGEGKAWVDDLFFGESQTTKVPSNDSLANNSDKVNDTRPWQNRTETRKFDSHVWISLDQSEWMKTTSVKIENEGIHTLRIGKSKSDPAPEEVQTYIDLTSPSVTLKIDPLPAQEAGVFTATPDTVYSVIATDTLSGVKKIEVTTDGKTFKDYSKSFKLPSGKYVLKCRATDRAGNQSSSIKGEWTTGSDGQSLEINVVPSK